MKLIKVVCGVVIRSNNQVLITQRGDDKNRNKWEFPGGKVEDGECDKEALKRELKEELDLEVYDLDFSSENIHHYDKLVILLIGYKCKTKSDPHKLTDHDKYEWVGISDLQKYNLADADIPLLKSI